MEDGMTEGNFYLSILIGVISGFVVYASGILSPCFVNGCDLNSLLYQIGFSLGISILIFVVVVVLFRITKKNK
jgi:hypothetical protein